MPCRVKCLTDKENQEYRNMARKKNYNSTIRLNNTRFQPYEDELIIQHKMTDRELSQVINRSVESIQVRRCRLLKKKGK